MPTLRAPPAPFVAPVGGDIDQRLSQIVSMINSLQATNVSPTFDHITLRDELGRTWALYMQSNGQIRTELVAR